MSVYFSIMNKPRIQILNDGSIRLRRQLTALIYKRLIFSCHIIDYFRNKYFVIDF